MDPGKCRRPGQLARSSRWLFTIWLGVLGASLVNPYGVDLFAHVFHLSESDFIRQNISEWQSVFYPTFREQRFFTVYAVFSVALFLAIATAFRRLRPSLLLLALGFWILTIIAVRHIPWFVIMGCYVLANVSKGTITAKPGGLRARNPNQTARAVLLSVLLLAGAVIGATHGNVRGVKTGFENRAPLGPKALRFIEREDLRGNVFNSYAHGDQLVYHFYPRLRVAMDSRLDAYGAEAFLEFRRLSGKDLHLLGEPQELLDFLGTHDVRTIVTRPLEYGNWAKKGHTRALDGAGWRVVYRGWRT